MRVKGWDKTETKLWAGSDCEKTLAKMLEKELVNSKVKDCPITPMHNTTRNKDTEQGRPLCTYFSSPNPALLCK